MRDVPANTVVDERYRIESRIGSGGMADVYCAQDLQLGRKVALKLLHQRFAEDSEFVERFRREASSAAGLQHANVVGVYDRGEWDGTYYIAMEYLEGRSLKDIVRAEGVLPPGRAIEIVIQILRAARFAHRRGVIHRDIKPHNVILDEEGRAKVTDFGIARAGASDMTETGSIMGTAQYLPPEQAQGHAVSAASDLYAIGIVLYELLAGRVPFDGESAVTIALKQVSEAPVPPSAYNPAVSPELDAVVLRALEKEPAARFRDADEFIVALEHARDQLGAVPVGQHTAAFGAAAVPDPAELAAAGVPVPAEPAEEVVPPPPLAEEPPLPGEEAPGRGRRWPWALLALLLLGGLALAFALTRPEKVKVPNVVGSQLPAASTVLENQGFKVDVQRRLSDQPKDRVLREDPQPGLKVSKGSTVRLAVSDGPGQASVPDVTKATRSDARRRLQAAGFKASFDEEPSDTVSVGRVTRTAPPAGSQVDKGTRVTVYLSTGPPRVPVPSVTGKDRDSAAGEVVGAGLKVSITEQESDQTAGTVLSQSPTAGTLVEKGSTVVLTVAREPQRVTVPSVVGRSESAASGALNGAGFSPSTQDQDVSDRGQDGKVLSQSPGGGSRAKRGSTVTIVVGRFKAPSPPSNPSNPTP